MSELRQFLTKVSNLNPEAGEIGDGMLRNLVETATELLDAPDYADELEAVMHVRKCSHCQAFQDCPSWGPTEVGCAYHRIKYAQAQAGK